MKQLEGVDVTKCLACKKGILPFIPGREEDGFRYGHLDLFATPEEGAIYPCLNSDTVASHLTPNERGVCDEDEELKEVMNWQSNWWDSVTELLDDIFMETGDINKFAEEERLVELGNREMEEVVIKKAESKGMEVDEERYPYLIKFEKEVEHGGK